MNKLPVYTITMKLALSPSQWDLSAMYKNLVPIRNAAYEVEAKHIEKLVDQSNLKDAKALINKIIEIK